MGRVLGDGDRSSNRFHPDGLKLFTLSSSIPLGEGQAIRTCIKCGLLWSYVEPNELSELIKRSGSDELKKRLAGAAMTDKTAGQASQTIIGDAAT